jgi:hypothetical protein
MIVSCCIEENFVIIEKKAKTLDGLSRGIMTGKGRWTN